MKIYFYSNDVPISTIVESQFLVPNLLSYSEVLNRSSAILNTASSGEFWFSLKNFFFLLILL